MDDICLNRAVSKDGRVICSRITRGDSTVTSAHCRECPARACRCSHLRFTLHKVESCPITVRYSTGRVEVWNDHAPAVRFVHAGCAERGTEIHGPEQCASCLLRLHTVRPVIRSGRARVLQFPGLTAKLAG